MVAKNNQAMKQAQIAEREVPHYGLRKLGIGVVSVLLGTTMYLGANSTVANADELANGSSANGDTSQTGASVQNTGKVVAIGSSAAQPTTETTTSQNADAGSTGQASQAAQSPANAQAAYQSDVVTPTNGGGSQLNQDNSPVINNTAPAQSEHTRIPESELGSVKFYMFRDDFMTASGEDPVVAPSIKYSYSSSQGATVNTINLDELKQKFLSAANAKNPDAHYDSCAFLDQNNQIKKVIDPNKLGSLKDDVPLYVAVWSDQGGNVINNLQNTQKQIDSNGPFLKDGKPVNQSMTFTYNDDGFSGYIVDASTVAPYQAMQNVREYGLNNGEVGTYAGGAANFDQPDSYWEQLKNLGTVTFTDDNSTYYLAANPARLYQWGETDGDPNILLKLLTSGPKNYKYKNADELSNVLSGYQIVGGSDTEVLNQTAPFLGLYDSKSAVDDAYTKFFNSFNKSKKEDPTNTASYISMQGATGRVVFVPEYDSNGNQISGKYAGAMFVWFDPKDSGSVHANYSVLDPSYSGIINPVYLYTGGGSGFSTGGFLTIPVNQATQTTGQVKFVDVTDPNNPVDLKIDPLSGQVGTAMDLTGAQNDLNNYLSSEGKYILADGNDDVIDDSKIKARNFTGQVANNEIVVNLTHIKKFIAHSNMVAIHGHLFVNGNEDPDFEQIATDLGNAEYETDYFVNLTTGKVVKYDTDLITALNTKFANLDKGIDAHASFDENTGILTVTYDSTNYAKANVKYADYAWRNRSAKQILTIDFSRTIPYVQIGNGFIGSSIPDIPKSAGVIQLNGENLPFKQVDTDPGIVLNWYLESTPQKAELKIIDQDAADFDVDNPYNSPAINVSGIKTIFDANGKPADQISFDNGTATVQGAIDALQKQGYELVSNSFDKGASFDNDSKTDQHFVVLMKHQHQDITPDQDTDNLVKVVTRTIDYKDTQGKDVNGSPDHKASYQQNVYFVRTAVKDVVTGKTLGYDLNSDGQVDILPNFGDQAWQAATKDADGKYTVNADADKFAKVTSQTPASLGYDNVNLPTVDGHAVSYNSPAETVHVIYSKNPKPIKEQGSVKVNYFDDTTQQALTKVGTTGLGYSTGKVDSGTDVAFSTHDTQIKVLKDAGYKVVSDPTSEMPKTVGNNDLVYTIHVEHQVIPVTPDKPGNGLKKTDLTKTVTETVHYVGAGDQTPADKTATLTFNGNGYYDSVTKKWTDAEGNELKDQAKNITWTSQDGNRFVMVVTPTVAGYTSSVQEDYDDGHGNVKEIAGIDQNSKNVDVTVTYTKQAPAKTQQSASLVINDITSTPVTQLGEYTQSSLEGDPISFVNAQERLNYLLGHGYTWKGASYNGSPLTVKNYQDIKFGNYDKTADTKGPSQQWVINLDHAVKDHTTTVTATAHVHYIMADGTMAPADSPVQTITWTKTDQVDQATGKTVKEGTWQADKDAFADVKSPEVRGYQPSLTNVQFNAPQRGVSQVVNVTYTKQGQKPAVEQGSVKVNYFDDTTQQALNKVGETELGYNTGKVDSGTAVDFSAHNAQIKALKDAGYKIVSDPTTEMPKTVSNNDLTYTIHVEHQIIPVTPDKPGNGLQKTDLTKTITETVHYVGAGDQTPADKIATLTFNGTAYYDTVTKRWTDAEGNELKGQTKNITWTAQNGNQFATVVTPAIDGYTSKVQDGYDDGQGNVKALTGINQNSKDVTVTVNYTKKAPTPVNDQQAIVNYVDADGGNKVITTSGNLTGKPGAKIDYSTAETIKDLENKGYVLVNDGFPTGATFDHDDSTTQTYTVVLKHGHKPVTPDDPGNGLNHDGLTKTVTETVHYAGAGDQTPADKTTQLTFNGTAYYDTVTTKWTDAEGNELKDQTKNITWTAQDGNQFNTVVTPTVDGYTSKVQDGYDDGQGNVKTIPGIDQNSKDILITVTYSKAPQPTTPKPIIPEPTSPEPTSPEPTTPQPTSLQPTAPQPAARTNTSKPVPAPVAHPAPNTVVTQPVSLHHGTMVAQSHQAAQRNNTTLPQTGNKEAVSAAALGLMGLALAGGFAATKKRYE